MTSKRISIKSALACAACIVVGAFAFGAQMQGMKHGGGMNHESGMQHGSGMDKVGGMSGGMSGGHGAAKAGVSSMICAGCTCCQSASHANAKQKDDCGKACPACVKCDMSKCQARGMSGKKDLGMTVLEPISVVTVPEGADFSDFRGFGQAAPMVAMMNQMMIHGSGMEGMAMAPMAIAFTAANFAAEWEAQLEAAALAGQKCQCCGMIFPQPEKTPSDSANGKSEGSKGADGASDHGGMGRASS